MTEQTNSTQATNAPVRRQPAAAGASRDAKNNPVQSASKEFSTTDMAVGQQPNVDFNDDEWDRSVQLEPVSAEQLQKDHLEAIAFNEEPVTILLNQPQEKNPPLTIDCWVNGVGAEVLINGKWVVTGWLPYNKRVTTKRKYAEVLAMSKVMSVRTEHEGSDVESPRNEVVKNNSPRANFQVLRDTNPKGQEWLTRVMGLGL